MTSDFFHNFQAIIQSSGMFQKAPFWSRTPFNNALKVNETESII